MSGNSTPKAPQRGDVIAPAPKRGKLSAQNRYNREARLARAWLLRHQPDVLHRIVRQVEREGSSPRTRGAFVQERTKRKKERVAAFTLIRLVTEAQEKESNEQGRTNQERS